MMTRREAAKRLATGTALALGAGARSFAQATGDQSRQYAPGSRNPASMDGMATSRRPGRKNLLAWGDVRNGFQHDSVSHAFSVIERLGYESQLYDTYIRTDSQPITKHGLYGSDGQAVYGKDLNDFDAIFFFGVREIDLTAQQRADLLSFIHDDGRGFVGVHTATTAFLSWPEFGDMLGGRFVDHPWKIITAPVIVEDPQFPATRYLPPVFNLTEEFYQNRGVNRAEVDVVLRLDTRHVNLNQPDIVIKNGDFPLAWSKHYGKGRVFYSALGHDRTTWDIPDIQRHYFEAVLWAMGLTGGVVRPHPEPPPPSAAPVALAPPLPYCGPAWARPKSS